MANLQIFGRTLNNVSSISVYDTSNVKHTFTEGGGTPTFIVHVDYTYTETSNTKTWTLTKTAGELLSLLTSGNIVFIQVEDTVGAKLYYQLAGVQRKGTDGTTYYFPCFDPNPTNNSQLSYAKVTYNPFYQANGLTAYPVYGVQSGGSND